MDVTKTIKWIKVDLYNEMSTVAANIFIKQLNEKPDSVLGFATGASPIGFYKQLVHHCQNGEISFSQVVSFNLDEYIGVPANSQMSYKTYMKEYLFDHVDIKDDNIYLPNSQTEDLVQECTDYEENIKKINGIDLQLLGIGVNGHIGFNEPGTPFDSLTHIVELSESTRMVNSRYFNSIEDVPTHAITMGIQSIMNTKAIVLLAFGESKRDAINRLRSGIVTEEFPASCLLNHENVTIIYGGF